MYTKLSLCSITLSLVTIVGNCAPTTSVPGICWTYLDAIRADILLLQKILPKTGATLHMPRLTGRPCARATIENFKQELDVLAEENVGRENVYNTVRNIQENIDTAWGGIEEQGNEEHENRYLLVEDALQELILYLQHCYSRQTSNAPCYS